MTVYKECRALLRGLDILRVMNLHGRMTPAKLSTLTGMHRTTVYRLLETLRNAGYVEKCVSGEAYRLAIKVRGLSEGFNDDGWIGELAAPVLGELQRQVIWPTDISVLHDDVMVIRETTHGLSPLSIHRSMIGQSWPVMTSASGRAHLAYCTDAERENLVLVLGESRLPANNRAQEPEYVAAIVRKTRERGYAESISECEKKMSAISIPICFGDRVLASMTTVFFTSAMTADEASKRFVPPMRRAAEEIVRSLESHTDDIFPRAETAYMRRDGDTLPLLN
jgi:IclR family mhp operon transcriptional activator